MSIPHLPPHLHIIIVGLIECNNGRTCELHPDGCGNAVWVKGKSRSLHVAPLGYSHQRQVGILRNEARWIQCVLHCV